MPEVFAALVEPARRQLLAELLDGPRAVGELAAAAGLTQPNTSRHLRILRDAGLVDFSAAGQRRLYALRAAGFAETARWLAPYLRRDRPDGEPVNERGGRSAEEG